MKDDPEGDTPLVATLSGARPSPVSRVAALLGRTLAAPWYTAKAEADAYLQRSDLVWTIARPGRLSFDDGTGLVSVGTELERGEPLPRPDLAAILAACLDQPATEGEVFEVVGGGAPVADTLAGLGTGT